MEYTYILAIKNAQNQAVFDNILEMFPELREQGRYLEGIYKKEPGDIPPTPFEPGVFSGPEYLLIKAESAKFDPRLLAGVESPFIFDGPDGAKNVHINFWT